MATASGSESSSSPTATVCVACTQMRCSGDTKVNEAKAEELVRRASAAGAQVILLQELFSGEYWCQEQKQEHFARAQPYNDCPLLDRMSSLAKELGVVIPVSFFERANNAFFNSLCMIDADGTKLGLYRKSHIPDGPGYQEKFYFSPGDTGFKVWSTRFGRVGCAVCWDQWFPEAARAMALQGADMLLYPTAIGSEPQDPSLDSLSHWQRVMQGHAAANLVPVIASNRIGREAFSGPPASFIDFYGSSFITDHKGGVMEQMGRDEEGFKVATLRIDDMRIDRAGWGLFRDRRPQQYGTLMTLDGGAT